MTARVALVTGSNKGIGYAIVRGLCKQFDGDVFLTARDVSRGQEAVSMLQGEGYKPRFHQLDVTDVTSVNTLAGFIKESYGGLDVLVHNAGMAYGLDTPVPVSEQATPTIRTNFWGSVNVSKGLLPLLKPGSRVVHMSSLLAASAWKKCVPDLKENLRACGTMDEVGALMDQYIKDAQSGSLEAWGSQLPYSASKIGLSLITSIQQREIDPDGEKDISVNCCCPGYVATDLTNHQGYKTIDQGAETPLYLALLPPNSDVRGNFVSSRKIKRWMER